MGHDDYISVSSDDGPGGYAQDAELKRCRSSRWGAAKRTGLVSMLTILVFALGFSAGNWHGRAGEGLAGSSAPVQQGGSVSEVGEDSDGLLPPQAFVPECEWSAG